MIARRRKKPPRLYPRLDSRGTHFRYHLALPSPLPSLYLPTRSPYHTPYHTHTHTHTTSLWLTVPTPPLPRCPSSPASTAERAGGLRLFSAPSLRPLAEPPRQERAAPIRTVCQHTRRQCSQNDVGASSHRDDLGWPLPARLSGPSILPRCFSAAAVAPRCCLTRGKRQSSKGTSARLS